MLWITGSKGLLGSALLLQCKAGLYRNNLKNRELGKEGPQTAHSEQATIAKGQGASENAQFEANPTSPKTDSSSCFGIHTGREVDIADLKAVRSFVKEHPGISHIVNCAAFSQVDDAEKFADHAFRANAVGPENLAVVAQEIGAKLIHISTDYVFAGTGKVPLKETDPTGPCGVYGKSKLVGEEKALQLGACVIRTSWIFGEGGKNLISKLWHMFQKEKEIRLTFDQWSRFTYAPDLAKAILQMLDEKGLYQFANQGIASKYEFALQLQKELLARGVSIATEAILPMSGKSFPGYQIRPVYSAFDTSKIEQKVSIRSWQAALKDFVCERQEVFL